MFSEKAQKQVCTEVYVESQVDVNLVCAKHVATQKSVLFLPSYTCKLFHNHFWVGHIDLIWSGSASEASHAKRN